MTGMTNEEVCVFIEKNKWATGLNVEHNGRTEVPPFAVPIRM